MNFFTFMQYDEFQCIPIIVSMWDFRNSFSRLNNIAEGKYFLVLLLQAQNKSSIITKDRLRRHCLLYALPDQVIDIFLFDAFEPIAHSNNSGVVCVLLRKILFSVASSLPGAACLAFTFPSGYVQRCYINAPDLTEWKFRQPNAIVPKVWPLSL